MRVWCEKPLSDNTPGGHVEIIGSGAGAGCKCVYECNDAIKDACLQTGREAVDDGEGNCSCVDDPCASLRPICPEGSTLEIDENGGCTCSKIDCDEETLEACEGTADSPTGRHLEKDEDGNCKCVDDPCKKFREQGYCQNIRPGLSADEMYISNGAGGCRCNCAGAAKPCPSRGIRRYEFTAWCGCRSVVASVPTPSPMPYTDPDWPNAFPYQPYGDPLAGGGTAIA